MAEQREAETATETPVKLIHVQAPGLLTYDECVLLSTKVKDRMATDVNFNSAVLGPSEIWATVLEDGSMTPSYGEKPDEFQETHSGHVQRILVEGSLKWAIGVDCSDGL